MRALTRVFKINVIEGLSYRVSAISGIITQFFFGFMMIMMFAAFLNSGQTQDFTYTQMCSYIWLQQSFFAFFSFSDVNKAKITNKIISGDIGYQLIRPMGLYDYWFAEISAKSVSLTLLRCFPILLITFIMPLSCKLSLPVSCVAFILFLISLILGFLIVKAINMLCYILVMKTLNGQGVFSFAVTLAAFFAGQIVPIPMLPSNVQTVFNFLPFRYVSDLAFRLYIGNISIGQGLLQIGVQVIWVVLLVILGKYFMKQTLKTTVVQGG